MLISVDLDKFPEHEEAIRRHVVEWLHEGKTARLDKDIWEDIKQSKNPPIRPKPKQKSRGLGDSIKKTTDKLGIKQCGKCRKRQQVLNKIFPYNNDNS